MQVDIGAVTVPGQHHAQARLGLAGVRIEELGAVARLERFFDFAVIPANRDVDAAEVERRLNALHRPYHAALARLAARRNDTVILAIHSFTPALKGRPPRPWHVGVLYSHLDDRLSRILIDRLMRAPDLCIGDNEPYNGHLPGDAIDLHALLPGRHNTLIELRNDLIGTDAQQTEWADRLAPILTEALGALPLKEE